MLTIEQIRAGRALLDWSQSDLADHADLSQTGIARIENGTNQPNTKTIQKIMEAFDIADIEFIGNTGVKKKTNEVRVLEGEEGFKKFIYDVYKTVRRESGEICVSNVDEREFDKWQGKYRDDYLSKMESLHKETGLSFRILVREGDEHHVAKYAKYKALKKENFGSVPFYVYGSKIAIILFANDDVSVYIIANKNIADAQRQQFDIVWSSAAS